MVLTAIRALTAPRPARRARPGFRPGLDSLEDRLVLSHVQVPALVHVEKAPAKAAQPIPLPIQITGLNITNVTSDANGVATATGTATGTLAGHAFTTPLTLTAPSATSAANPTAVSVLHLQLDPIHLDLLGLKVDTSKICVDITAQPGQGALLGNLVAGLANALNPSAGGTTGGAGTTTPPTASQLNNLLGNSTLLGGVNSILNQVTQNLAGPASVQSASRATKVLTLAVGPVNLNLLGLQVKADNCANGPITVAITAQPGPGRLLGNLITDVANLLNKRGNHTTQLTKDLRSIVNRVTAARAV